MSRNGLCSDCWQARHVLNNLDLHEHRGPYFDHWRRRSAAAVGAILVDDLPPAA